MNKTFGLIIGAVAVVGLVLSYTAVTRPIPQPPFGSIPGTVVSENCFSIGGVERCYYKDTVKTATTTVCSFKSPAATSTLLGTSIRLSTASSSATGVLFAKSTGNNTASTTVLSAVQAIAASQAFSFVLSDAGDLVGQYTGAVATTLPKEGRLFFPPNNRLNISIQGGDNPGGNLTGLTPAGTCNATFEIL